jgi:large subunit ribosomal protein L30
VADVKLKQVRSSNGTSATQRATLRSLKLGRIGKESTMTQTPQLDGMLDKVSHLVERVED